MPIPEFPPPPQDRKHDMPCNRERDQQAMRVLHTTYSADSDALWSTAMANLSRWVAQYFVHDNRPYTGKPDGSVNEELGRRLVLEVLDDAETVSALKGRHLPADLTAAKTSVSASSSSQENFEKLTRLFDGWVHQTVGPDRDDNITSPRFCDFLVVDNGALCSLATLPNEIPLPDPTAPREQRVDEQDWCAQAYVWLVDFQAVASFDPDNKSDRYESDPDRLANHCYRGWVKLRCSDIVDARFERLARASDDEYVFSCYEWSGDWWYTEG